MESYSGEERALHFYRSGSALPAIEENSPRLHGTPIAEGLRNAIEATRDHLLGKQQQDGYWWFELESNVTMTAEYLMLLFFLGIDSDRYPKMANHILRNQRPDGAWAIHWGGDGDLSTTVEAYFALKLAGTPASDERMQRARTFILDQGGAERSRVFTKIFLALFGQFDWRGIPSIPVELVLLPSWSPLNIYAFSSWARCTIVPLSVILEIKPEKLLSEECGIQELFLSQGTVPPITLHAIPPFSWKKVFLGLDRFMKKIENSRIRVLKPRALDAAKEWILTHQGPEGDWGGIQPAMVNSVIALTALGSRAHREEIRKGLGALERFSIETHDEIVLQSCISPVWDTALTVLALLNSGMPKHDPRVITASQWLLSRQILTKGDWSICRPALQPGGWAFEFENSWYPDVDDSAVVLMVLRHSLGEPWLTTSRYARGLNWVVGMQGKDGGWGAFDADNDLSLLNQLPFGDLEAMIDPSTPDLTGRVLELLGLNGFGLTDPRVKKAIRFLRKTQEEDGSWWGRWGVNYVYGTSAVLNGLQAIGESMSQTYVRKAVKWFKMNQNSDGGWGECCESYHNRSLKCTGESTPSQTSWALLALMAAGEDQSEEVSRGVAHLLHTQNADGTWDETCFTGTGFPKYFMLKYHNYRNCFPLMALGRYAAKGRQALGPR